MRQVDGAATEWNDFYRIRFVKQVDGASWELDDLDRICFVQQVYGAASEFIDFYWIRFLLFYAHILFASLHIPVSNDSNHLFCMDSFKISASLFCFVEN